MPRIYNPTAPNPGWFPHNQQAGDLSSTCRLHAIALVGHLISGFCTTTLVYRESVGSGDHPLRNAGQASDANTALGQFSSQLQTISPEFGSAKQSYGPARPRIKRVEFLTIP